ncbi:hypothetical protein KFK09_002404 [Dendrobium nobile]|uniref:Uncharacterized protein n=1 Tax=Dendrobium nobile TaxID=94219 RepID=A0A8T3C751_DENNO|nr:hypothetical protein KFK09_002404 [Dendrobium nobile]
MCLVEAHTQSCITKSPLHFRFAQINLTLYYHQLNHPPDIRLGCGKAKGAKVEEGQEGEEGEGEEGEGEEGKAGVEEGE